MSASRQHERSPLPLVKTFVVRLWRAADEDEAHASGLDDLRGTVERIGAGDLTPFRNDRELLRVLRTSTASIGYPALSDIAKEERR